MEWPLSFVTAELAQKNKQIFNQISEVIKNLNLNQQSFYIHNSSKVMASLGVSKILEVKKIELQMEDTKSESENLIKNPEIAEQCFQKMRQHLHWKITLSEQIDFIGRYALYQLLKSGRYFDLYRAINKGTKQRVVVKIIDKHAIKQGLTQLYNQSVQIEEYDQFLQKLYIQHQAMSAITNRISRIFLIENQFLSENVDCIVKVTGNYYGETLERILQRRISLPTEEALAVIKQVLYQLSQLHKQNIILTQLNPSSIVYRNGVFKISDFSSMRKVSHNFKSTINLLHQYSYEQLIAPELKVCPQIIDIKSEIWAVGVLFYHLIAHDIPYEERGLSIVKKAKSHNVSVQTKTGQASSEVLNFLRQLLESDPDERISWKKLVNHPIFQNQDYFNSLKTMPIVDVRNSTLKKKQNDLIQEEVMNADFIGQELKKNTFVSKIALNQKALFKTINQCQKLDIHKILDIEAEAFYHIQHVNLRCHKAIYIYNQILLKLQSYNLVDYKRRSHVQTVHLIAERCFQLIRKCKSFQNKMTDPRVDNYLEQLKVDLQKIREFYNFWKQKFKSIDSSSYYISNDIFSSFVSKQKCRQRCKFFKGKQGIDYTGQQIIKFIKQKCIDKILPQLKGDSTVLQYVKINLRNFQKINSISLQEISGEYCFSDAVTKAINLKNKIN